MAYVGPGDLKTYRVWSGLRGYSAAYAAPGNNPCCDIYVSNVLVGTVNILSNGAMDTATAAALIGGGTGKIGKLYDQTGGGNHFLQTSDAIRPTLVFSAPGLGAGQPAMNFLSSGMLTTSNIPSTTQPWTMTCFAITTVVASFADIISTLDASANELFLGYNGANTAQFQAPNVVTKAETDNAWHSLVGVANGTLGTIAVDGAASTSQNTGASVPDGAHKLFINNNQQQIGSITQVGYAEGGFSEANIAALNTNDQFWFTSLALASVAPGANRVGGPGVRRSMRTISY